mmetsp:Transcript_3799/g.4788  ORF Transcript_3799/g.4788 Transcript_3799/m.4788 type:complete len:128 (-) Transcript_3799:6-389(-)
MASLDEEQFKQRLLLLAAENDGAAPSASEADRDAPGKDAEDLEDKVKELLSALNRERPTDPLTAEQAEQVNRAAECAPKLGSEAEGATPPVAGSVEEARPAEPPKEAALTALLASAAAALRAQPPLT